jgi:hypothetical protein
MNKHYALCALMSSALITPIAHAKTDSYSELDIGFDHISYEETLSDLAQLGKDGKISQAVSVTNPTLRTFSFSEINDKWGLIVKGSSTLATSVAQERWKLGSFGTIQEDEFKLKYAEIGVALAYKWRANTQLVIGGTFTSSSFTRSNFEKVQPGAGRFEAAISPATFEPAVGAVNEDQYAFLATASLRYDTRLTRKNSPWSFYSELGANLPVYVAIQNTSIPKETLTDSFNGWGIYGDVGVRYHWSEKLSLKMGLHGQYSQRKEIEITADNNRLRVPDINLTSLGLGLGISWLY